MKYPNALAGIKKILTSQFMQIISTVCLLFGAVIVFAGANESSTALVIVGGAVTLVAAIVGIIALIFNLIGLNSARKDESTFWMAFVYAILAIIASVLSAVLASINPDVADWLTFASRLFELGVIETSVMGIVSLSEKLGREDVASFGRNLRNLILILWLVVLVVRFFGNRMERISNIMDIISSVLELVVFIIYIVLLTKAKQMLEKS